MKRSALSLTVWALLGTAAGAWQWATAQAHPATMPGMTIPAARAVVSPAVKALKLTQGWVAAAPPGAEELSAYLVLSNPGTSAVKLTGGTTALAGQLMLMTTGHDAAGRDTMQMAAALKVPAGGSLKILPGTAHLMLRFLKRQPQPGETVAVTLRFSDGSARTFSLPVRRLP